MSDREEVAREVAQKLAIIYPTMFEAMAEHPPILREITMRIWDALISSELRVKELERGNAMTKPCVEYIGEPGGNCTRCGLIAYEHRMKQVQDHKWLDHECQENGCQSLLWKERIEKLEGENKRLREALATVIAFGSTQEEYYDAVQRARAVLSEGSHE